MHFSTFVLECQAFFEDFLRFLEEPIDLRHFSSVFSEAFVSDIRLTVIYFSTDSDKKQALFSHFSRKALFSFARLIPITAPAFCAGSCAPAGRSVPAWYAALLPSHSGCGWHKTAGGSGAGPLPADFPAPRPGRSYPQVLPPEIPPGYLSALSLIHI